MEIKIDRIYGVKPQGEFRCYFDLTLFPWGIHIYACKLFEGTKGNLWVRTPQRIYTHQGRQEWADVVSIDDPELRGAISLAARRALQEN